MNIAVLISQKKKALKQASPKSRDRIRHRLNVLKRAQQMKRECRSV